MILTEFDIAKAYGGPMEYDKLNHQMYLVDRETGKWATVEEIFSKYFGRKESEEN